MKRISFIHLTLLMLALCGCQSPNQYERPPEGTSASTTATIAGLDVPAPVAPQAVGGQLDLTTLAGANVTVQMTYPAIAQGDTVGMRWTGTTVYDAPVQTVGATRPLIFSIPNATARANKGASAALTGSVGVGDSSLVISQPLTVNVIETPPAVHPGQQVANDLNTRYANTSLSCTGNTPAYYCNGVIIRSTENGNYYPWNPSPNAILLGGVSFSYMRKDAYVTGLYHQSGFTFLAQEQAIAKGKVAEYLCIYAYDAGTLVGVRGAQGCGLKPRSAPMADASTCTNVGVSTVAQWYTYTKTLPNRDYQCSLSTANAAQFAVSFQVRANRPPNMEALWNEMMVKTWAQDIPGSLPLESFFTRRRQVWRKRKYISRSTVQGQATAGCPSSSST
jgi:hypothetical protein